MAAVAVIGSGAWGTALACHAARLGHSVRMWALEPEVAEEIDGAHTNSLYLAGAMLPTGISASTSLEGVVTGAELVIMVPPSKHLRTVSHQIRSHLPTDAVVAVASKGIEESSLKLMSEVLMETVPELGADRLAFLSGPSFAKEVIEERPTDVAVASADSVAAHRVQRLLHAPRFRVYSSSDPIGVQVGGAVKNVIAVATGAADGLGFGANGRAGLLTRGLAEVTRLGVALGANPLTFLGLAGVGDLYLTATGDLSRNRTLGKQVAAGVDPKNYVASQRTVAEGFFTAAAAHQLAGRCGVEMPITEQVYEVLHRGRPLTEAVDQLLHRDFKDELYGIV